MIVLETFNTLRICHWYALFFRKDLGIQRNAMEVSLPKIHPIKRSLYLKMNEIRWRIRAIVIRCFSPLLPRDLTTGRESRPKTVAVWLNNDMSDRSKTILEARVSRKLDRKG